MKILLDSANIAEITYASRTGLIDGVTTNPSSLKATGTPLVAILDSIISLVKGPVSYQVLATNAVDMIKQANHISQSVSDQSDQLVIKLPCTLDGFRACQELSRQRTYVNMTLCFSVSQAILAAKSGALFVSPFLGRIEDQGEFGSEILSNIIRALRNYPEYKHTEILASSIRSVSSFTTAALIGADVITVPYPVFQSLSNHSLTQKGLAKFLEDSRDTARS